VRKTCPGVVSNETGLALFLTADYTDFCHNLLISKSLCRISHFNIGFVFHFFVGWLGYSAHAVLNLSAWAKKFAHPAGFAIRITQYERLALLSLTATP
jgi:hypothetical protein